MYILTKRGFKPSFSLYNIRIIYALKIGTMPHFYLIVFVELVPLVLPVHDLVVLD